MEQGQRRNALYFILIVRVKAENQIQLNKLAIENMIKLSEIIANILTSEKKQVEHQ